ncbi:Putative protein of unknown function [Podospora comata]|uniref:Uncharacterized protein n=1 Tax=Podospora comata TaxID=48703 RepID=A0ABY6SK33_PODCO|nr:Putative protein of unknown function [Podospora comata]
MDGYIIVPHEKYLTSCSRNLGTLDLNLATTDEIPNPIPSLTIPPDRECPTSYPFPKAQPKQALFTSRDQCHPELHRSGTTPKMRGISPQLARFQKPSSPVTPDLQFSIGQQIYTAVCVHPIRSHRATPPQVNHPPAFAHTITFTPPTTDHRPPPSSSHIAAHRT